MEPSTTPTPIGTIFIAGFVVRTEFCRFAVPRVFEGMYYLSMAPRDRARGPNFVFCLSSFARRGSPPGLCYEDAPKSW